MNDDCSMVYMEKYTAMGVVRLASVVFVNNTVSALYHIEFGLKLS